MQVRFVELLANVFDFARPIIFYVLELVKAISVPRAHRLLPGATPILWRNRLSVTVSVFDRLLSDIRYQLQAKQHSPRLINRPFRDCPFHLLLLNGCGFCRFLNSPAVPPTLGFARQDLPCDQRITQIAQAAQHPGRLSR